MKAHNLKTEIWLPQKRTTVFNFFTDPRNLEELTPKWLHFEILSPMPLPMEPGALIDYRLRLYGIPLRWQSKISVWEPPSRFVDTQTRGPYSLWIHEHTFVERDRGTVVGDTVSYAALGGRIVNQLLVAPDLSRIFRYRHEVLHNKFNPQRLRPSPTENEHAGPQEEPLKNPAHSG